MNAIKDGSFGVCWTLTGLMLEMRQCLLHSEGGMWEPWVITRERSGCGSPLPG